MERLKKIFTDARLLWDSSQHGTAIRTEKGYRAMPPVQVRKHKPTEAEDNAAGRRSRRRTNKLLRVWRPYAQR